MTGSSAGDRNRVRGREFRNELLVALQSIGVVSARLHEREPGASSRVANLLDLPGWSLLATTRTTSPFNLSEQVNLASDLAAHVNAERSALAVLRRGRPVSEAYVITTVHDFATSITGEVAW